MNIIQQIKRRKMLLPWDEGIGIPHLPFQANPKGRWKVIKTLHSSPCYALRGDAILLPTFHRNH